MINFNLSVSIFKEGDSFIAYAPALDLSTSGKTFEEVEKRFKEVVNIFFQETTRKETLNDVLSELGWKKNKRQWRPPPLISHETQNFKVSLPV